MSSAGSWVDLLDVRSEDRVLLLDSGHARSAVWLAARCQLLEVAADGPTREAARPSLEPSHVAGKTDALLRQTWDVVCVDGLRLTDPQLEQVCAAVAPSGKLALVIDNAVSPLRLLDSVLRRPTGPAPAWCLSRVSRRLRRLGLEPEQVFGLLRSSAEPVTAFDLDSPAATAAVVQATLSHVGGLRGILLRRLTRLDRRTVGLLVPAWLLVASRGPRSPDPLRVVGKVGNRESFEAKIVRGDPPEVIEKHYRRSISTAEVDALTELAQVGFELTPRLIRPPAHNASWTSWLPGQPLVVRRLAHRDLVAWTKRASEVIARLQDLTRRPDGTVLVHGDLWLGNLLVQGDRITGLVDWTHAHRGSAEYDRRFVVDSLSVHRRTTRRLRRRLRAARDGVLPPPREPDARACVLGGMDIIRPLAAHGITCAAFLRPREPARYSRQVAEALDAMDPWQDPEAYVDRLVGWAARQPSPPVLLYPTDGDLVMASRHRDQLGSAFRLLLPSRQLVDDLTDKSRFRVLAHRLGLSVPASRHLHIADGPEAAMELSFPVVIKPIVHRDAEVLLHDAKAIRVATPAALVELWPRVQACGLDCLAQELVPGPETRIETYHAYVDAQGHSVGEYAGRKLRTHPREFGYTTALEITERADVMRCGREVTERLGLRGVLKADFKRDPDGRLWLLEVNPRFNLWQHAGAVAGVNLPALYYADLTGHPRPRTELRPGVTWCDLTTDRRAVLASGRSTGSWLWAASRFDTRSSLSLRDPMPFVRGILLPGIGRRIRSGAGPDADARR